MVVDREKVLAVLSKRFPHALPEDVAAAANAIVGLDLEYRAIDPAELCRFECLAGADKFTAADVGSGQVRIYRRLA